MKRPTRWILASLAVATLALQAGCAAKAKGGMESQDGLVRHRQAAPPEAMFQKALHGEASNGPSAPPASPPEAATRIVHYNGFARLRVTGTTDALDHASTLATDAGGYVEKLTPTSITLRVPVAQFASIFAAVLKLGDVLSKSVTAEDVTEAYEDLDLRLQTAKATRDRLVALLAQAKKEAERIQLLQEIQRLSEEIDDLETSIKTLTSLAAFSRITAEVMPRQAASVRSTSDEIAEFRWIQRLSPFNHDVANEGRRLDIAAPSGTVLLSKEGPWTAESADGAVLRTSRRKNAPRGDSAFWVEAIRTRLAPEFASATVFDAGQFKLVEFVDRTDSPYHYLVGVRVEGNDLDLVEVYYPTPAQQARYGDAVLSVIVKGMP